MNDSKDHKAAAEPPLDCRVGPLPVLIIACGGWSCNGPSGHICDWQMSDGTVQILSMREVDALRANG
jgi:hypothetical protein